MREPIIDAWIQHPTAQFIGHDMFASLRRWMKLDVIPDEIPIELTLTALDAAGVSKALTSAWWGPDGPLLSNDEVARTFGRSETAVPLRKRHKGLWARSLRFQAPT